MFKFKDLRYLQLCEVKKILKIIKFFLKPVHQMHPSCVVFYIECIEGIFVDKSVFQMDPPEVALERRFKAVTEQKPGIKMAFDRIRAQLAQEAEQRSRPVSRIYSGFRALKA